MKEKLSPWQRAATLKQIRGFAAVASKGSVSAAAKQLHLTAPAVSLQLRELEKAAGIPLLERKENALIPTNAGKAVLELAGKLHLAMTECGELLDALGGIDRGEASIGVVSTARYFAPMVLAAFSKLHPQVSLQLFVGNRAATIEKLENLEIDFAVTGLPPTHFEVRSEHIGRHPQIIIAPPDHALAESPRFHLSELKTNTFLLREPGSGTRSVADSFFTKNQFSPDRAIEFGSNETIKQAVIAGMGVALISAHTVAAELEAKRLVALNIRGMPINRKWFVVKHKNKHFVPSSQALWNFFSRAGKTFLPAYGLPSRESR